MVKEKDTSKFGDVIAPNLSLPKANAVRSHIKRNSEGYWVFVVKNRKNEKYDVSVQNTWGAALSGEELHAIKKLVRESNVLVSLKEEVEIEEAADESSKSSKSTKPSKSKPSSSKS